MRTKLYPFGFFFLILISLQIAGNSQCTNATLNWSNVDYLRTSGNYSGFVSGAAAATQRFTIGTNAVTIATTGATINGENNNQTADAGTEVDYDITSGTITLTFDNEVSNAGFSIYDIDRRQIVAINSKNALGVDVNTKVVKRNGASTIITLSPAGGVGTTVTTTACTSSGCAVATSSNNGTIDVTVAGPVKTITITVSNSGSVSSPDLYLSNITACVTGSFPNSYYNVSRPFTGQPSYVLVSLDDSVFYVNATTGAARLLFVDPLGNNINSMGYDPYNRFVYYTYSLTATPGTDYSIEKYDLNTGVFSTIISDVRTIGVILYESGVESGAAGFYNGNLYFGVEGYGAGGAVSGRESIVWRLDFNGSNVPYRATQVYAMDADNGSTTTHDWGDIGVSNGVLYDFDGKPSYADFSHYDLQTGVLTNYAPSPSSLIPRQVSIDWQENLYNVGTAAASSKGTIVPYNLNGTVNLPLEDTIRKRGVALSGSWGDAAEAFRPLCDFGDAPATYDAALLSPAVNEMDSTIRIGLTFDKEWNKTASLLANADGSDEDGIGTVTIFATASGTYHVQVSVYNHSGATARLMGWLDYNGNGVFDAGEASALATVNSSLSMQNIYLNWTGISSALLPGSYTYLRIRFTSSISGMTSANATGWYDNGETEDYRVPVTDLVLPLNLISFDAKAINNSNVKLTWSASEEINVEGYDIEKSRNGSDWEYIDFVPARPNDGRVHNYELTDNNPYKGISNYRLKIKENNSAGKYSEVRVVKITDVPSLVALSPNPAVNYATLNVSSSNSGAVADIYVTDSKGNRVFSQRKILSAGNNIVQLPVQLWPSGTYVVSVGMIEGATAKKLVIQRQ